MLPEPEPPPLVTRTDAGTLNEYGQGIQFTRRESIRGALRILGKASAVWLLALRTLEWVRVSLSHPVTGCFAPAIRSQWGNRLIVESAPSELYHLVAIACFSSEISSLLNQCQPTDPVLLCILDTPRRGERVRRHLTTTHNVSCHYLSHVETGGITTHSCWFVVRPPLVTPPVVMPRHSIASVIDYGVYLPSKLATVDALPLTDLLPFHTPDQLIAIPNRFMDDHSCMRRLQPKELWSAWDLPSWVPPPISRMRALQAIMSIPPLKGLLAMMDAVLPSLHLPSVPLGAAALPSIDPPQVDPRGSWLPSIRRWLPSRWIDGVDISDKAAKADAAAIPKQLWNLRVTLPLAAPTFLLERLRQWFHRLYVRRVFLSMMRFLRREHGTTWCCSVRSGGVKKGMGDKTLRSEETIDQGMEANLESARRVLLCADRSDFWEWKGGSSLFFWRWGAIVREARDGFPICVRGPLPRYKRKQKQLNPDLALRLAEKIHDQRLKGYIEPLEPGDDKSANRPLSDVDYFPVPKVECPVTGTILDVRVVYNGTSSGLNDMVWAPNFWLPTPNTALRQLDYGYSCVDFDLGEMFLNFPLEKKFRTYAGVRTEGISHLLNEMSAARAQ